MVDRENILWVASKTKGISSLPLQNFPIYKWNYSNLVHSSPLTKESHLLTFKNNIVKLRFTNGKPTFTEVFFSPNKEINCATIQFGNELFYGTNKGMFLFFHEANTEFTFDELKDKKVTHIEKIGNGDLAIIASGKEYIYEVYLNQIKIFDSLEYFEDNTIQKIEKDYFLLGKGNVYKLKTRSFYRY